ncbi:MAG: hypothetical protein OEZ34_00415 [Spirochaetia bacterium]|nr:hypothetical protein [Spirochaetia bacterium]
MIIPIRKFKIQNRSRNWENLSRTEDKIRFEERWYFLEGVILDKAYLEKIQKKCSNHSGPFCSYGIYIENLKQPQIEWDKNHTFIQETGIDQNFELFDTPDVFYKKHSQKLNFIKYFVY